MDRRERQQAAAPFHRGRRSPILAFAGLWDRSIKPDGTSIESCVHITLPANDLMREIHNGGNNPHRMPAILRREDQEVWLKGSADEARAVLRPYEPGLMVAFEVSTAVNSPKNNNDKLLEPVVRGNHPKIAVGE